MAGLRSVTHRMHSASGEQPVLGERQDEHGHTGGQHCPDDEPGHADRGGYAAVAFHDVSLFI